MTAAGRFTASLSPVIARIMIAIGDTLPTTGLVSNPSEWITWIWSNFGRLTMHTAGVLPAGELSWARSLAFSERQVMSWVAMLCCWSERSYTFLVQWLWQEAGEQSTLIPPCSRCVTCWRVELGQVTNIVWKKSDELGSNAILLIRTILCISCAMVVAGGRRAIYTDSTWFLLFLLALLIAVSAAL